MANLWWPLDSPRITGGWGNSPSYYAQYGQLGHNGVDLGCPIGTPVYAAESGTIFWEGWGQNHPQNWMGAVAGICVIIRHADLHTGYAHLDSTVVNVGQHVNRGDLIGYSGNTGGTTGPHLHTEVLPLNPKFNNGFAGRINPDTVGGYHARGSSGESPLKKNKGLSMYDLYWTGPTTKNTNVSGRMISALGSFWVPNMQVYNLLLRRRNALLNAGAGTTDNMLDAEHDILNNYLRSTVQSAVSGIALDGTKYLKALNDAVKELGSNLVITPEMVNIDSELLAKAFDLAVPRIVDAIVKESGKKLSA